MSNEATVASDVLHPDIEQAAIATTTIRIANLRMVKGADANVYKPSSLITYTLTVTKQRAFCGSAFLIATRVPHNRSASRRSLPAGVGALPSGTERLRLRRVSISRRFYRPARNAYQRTLNRGHFRERLRLRGLFRPFIGRGSLVFDVGAHRGHYAETFRELGAQVVAVEPNPSLAEEIRRHFPGITVEAKAVGSERGTATLRVGRDDQHSTVSDAWADAHPERWEASVDVPVVTLADLIAVHGKPAFIKIDVEGFEAHVLRGLDRPVPALCFEFQAAAPDPDPFRILCGYEFAVSTEPFTLGLWGTADDAWAQLQAFADIEPHGSGDVFARHVERKEARIPLNQAGFGS